MIIGAIPDARNNGDCGGGNNIIIVVEFLM